jgi:putative ABC transport system ATP-binding protein
LLKEVADAGTTVVMVTHSPSHAKYANRTINLLDGQIVDEAQQAV